VKDAAPSLLEILIRLRSLERPQHEPRQIAIDSRAHRRDVRLPAGIERDDDPFQNQLVARLGSWF
jgi:hypothetical protein